MHVGKINTLVCTAADSADQVTSAPAQLAARSLSSLSLNLGTSSVGLVLEGRRGVNFSKAGQNFAFEAGIKLKPLSRV